jgi:hypothetical protein
LKDEEPMLLATGPKVRLRLISSSNRFNRLPMQGLSKRLRYPNLGFPRDGAWNNGSITANNGLIRRHEDGKGHSLL